MRILAIDPAIRNTGYAVVEGDYRRARALDYGTLTIPRSVSQSGCLLAIKQHLGNLIDKWNPDEMAVERIIYVQSHQTAITMGAAKAAVVIAAAEAADALAIGLTHLFSADPLKAHMMERKYI